MAPTLEKPRFVCHECGYKTNNKNRLINHVNGVHLNMNGSKENDNDEGEEINDESSGSQRKDTPLFPVFKSPLTPKQKTPKPKTPKPKTPKSKRKAEPASVSPSTPKRINLSIEGKRDILKKYDALPKMSQESAANMLKIPRESLRKILSRRDEIIAAPKSEIKRLGRVGKDVMVEDSLIKWFDMVRDKNATITHEILRDKAEELAKKLGHNEFKASSGWLTRLLKRRDISRKKLLREQQRQQDLIGE